MLRKFEFTGGEYYHIYNRGVDKRTIFLHEDDYRRFQHLLYLTNGTKPIVFKTIQGLPLDKEVGSPLTSLVAYALMPNHFHIIARETQEGGLSKFVGKLSTAYSMYFNVKYERSGPLLCRPFKARHIHFDDYFRWVFSYVHLNPLDVLAPGWKVRNAINSANATQFLESYAYSSYGDYFGPHRPESKIIDKTALPIPIRDIEDAREMLEEFVEIPEDCEIEVW